MSLDRRSEEHQPVRGMSDLVAWFRSKERPPSEWKVGIEHEKVGLVTGTLRPIPYGGPRGIEAMLRGFGRYGYQAFEEEGRVIASERAGLTVSIEPGGQLELSGRPFKDVHVVAAELEQHLEKCRALAAELGVELLAVGYRPWGTPATAEWVPKARYRVMRPFLEARGGHGADMMSMTASTQASFDFGSERDMAEKLRVALAAQPAVAALYANSPIVDGRECGWKSFRVGVWTDVDPVRCGLLPFAFEPSFLDDPYRAYADWALDVPMILLRRGGRYLDTRAKTFREFLIDGIAGERPTISDWEDHLTTLFPEARVKSVVEVRGADACDAAMTMALPALWKGILYDRSARQRAWDVVAGFTIEQRQAMVVAAGRDGLAARTPDGRTLARVASELLEVAADGLCRQSCCGQTGEDERVWLAPLQERAGSGRSPADDALEAFRRGGDRALAEHLRIA